ncbi:MAG: hypothetical protein ACFFBP_11515 [Promethearchaeota archaeon]
MVIKDMLGAIEQFEGVLDTYNQAWKKQYDELIKGLSETYKLMKVLEKENEELNNEISVLNSQLTSLKTKSEEMDNKIEGLRSKKEESTLKMQELNADLEKIISDSKKPQFELENLVSKVDGLNEKISAKEAEKAELDQKKIDNENKENQLSGDQKARMAELEKQIARLKQENFFPMFVYDHAPEEISEVDIIATIMEKGNIHLDNLKKSLDIPPIMLVRTIKQLALKGLINLDENTNEISLP